MRFETKEKKLYQVRKGNGREIILTSNPREEYKGNRMDIIPNHQGCEVILYSGLDQRLYLKENYISQVEIKTKEETYELTKGEGRKIVLTEVNSWRKYEGNRLQITSNSSRNFSAVVYQGTEQKLYLPKVDI